MKIKKLLILILIILLASFITSILYPNNVNADVIEDMSGVKDGLTEGYSTDSGIGGVINIIIGLLQVAGTGISVIMVTWLGIKYIISSVEEKAEIKKQAVPIVIGAVLLFGAVNLMAALEQFASDTVNAED